jgi:diguanylate cyclase (GGDEF)-like protein
MLFALYAREPSMAERSEKDEVLADYTALLAALLPQAEGFFCHDQRGQLFWFDKPELVRRFEDDPAYLGILERVLEVPGAQARELLQVGDCAALVLSLDDGQGGHHGAITVVLPAAENLPVKPTVRALRPVLRTLRRELSLRHRLLASKRKLAVQAAEEKLLHHVESLMHQPLDSTDVLDQILKLCCTYLSVSHAGLVIPGKQIQRLCAEGLREDDSGQYLDALLSDHAAARTADRVIIPVGTRGSASAGQLVLAGWGASALSDRRRRRLARYIASHVASVVERDFDHLTGLLAWSMFEARLAALSDGEADVPHVLLYLDVDQLHVINENYGRAAGDEVLSGFSRVLQDCLPGHAMSRISSDSFAVLIATGNCEQARAVGEDICRRFAALEFQGAGKPFHASVSIGIAPVQGSEETGSGPLAAAQVACRAAKDRGTGRVEIYEPADQSIVRRMGDIHLVGHVREAISEDRLVLLGQPIRSLRRKEPFQYQEVLVRMLDDAGRQVEPGEFLSAAERYQLMKELDRWVVARSLTALRDSGLSGADAPARLAVNLSGQSLGDEQFLSFVQQQIQRSGVAPSLICFEITETVAMANMQRAQAFMHALKRMGCRFSLDDFGTGLSSFAYLKLFPVDTLKIDGSFVRDLSSNKVSQSVVAAISEVARVMELETVAEFVQDEASLELLRGLGVHWGQGYLLGEPALLSEQLQHPGSAALTEPTSSLRR